MPRHKISLAELTMHAMGTVDRAGFEALSLAVVAEALGVRSSALYTHVEGLDGLRHLVAVTATRELTADLRNATIGRARDDAVGALGHAYRDYALTNPGRYGGVLFGSNDRHGELASATAELDAVFRLVVAGYGMDGEAASISGHTTRCAIHGFVTLEIAQPFADQAEAAQRFDHLLMVLAGSLA